MILCCGIAQAQPFMSFGDPSAADTVRPMMQWREWANQPKPFLRSALFILFFSVVLWAAMPKRLELAESPVRTRFWRSFLLGVLVVAVGVVFARVSIRTMLGWPLGMLALAVLEFALLSGLAVMVSILGQRIGQLLALTRWPLVGSRDSARRFAELLMGALVCALLLQIPALGPLPPLGTRLVSLLAVLGLGGIFRTRSAVSAASGEP